MTVIIWCCISWKAPEDRCRWLPTLPSYWQYRRPITAAEGLSCIGSMGCWLGCSL